MLNNQLKINIIRAVPKDAARLKEIAFISKRYWGYPESWIKLWEKELTITSQYIINQTVYCAEKNGQAVGFYALILNNGILELDHLWVLPELIGCGVGKTLIHHAFVSTIALGYRTVKVVADPNAKPFYESMGAQHVSDYSYQFNKETRVLPELIFNLIDNSM